MREKDSYALSPSIDYADRQSWLWMIAQPSAYATLVEFVERLQRQDYRELEYLVEGDQVISAAVAFGLYLPERRYEIVAYDESKIVFRDRQGAFVMTFTPPQSKDAPWLIASLNPIGAAVPIPAPTDSDNP